MNSSAPESPRSSRRERPWHTGARLVFVVLVALLPAACADMDPAYNPIEWGRSIGRGVSEAVGSDPGPEPLRVEPPPAEGRPYPNLATVPRPPQVESAAMRQTEMEQLTATRDAAIKADQALRAIPSTPSIPPQSPQPVPRSASAPPVSAAAQGEPQGAAQPSREKAQAAVVPPRPTLPPSLFMGTVTVQGDAGSLAAFQQKIIEDAAAMAVRNKARIRLVGGTSATDRQQLIQEFVRLGVPANRITAAPAEGTPTSPPRPTVDVFVDY